LAEAYCHTIAKNEGEKAEETEKDLPWTSTDDRTFHLYKQRRTIAGRSLLHHYPLLGEWVWSRGVHLHKNAGRTIPVLIKGKEGKEREERKKKEKKKKKKKKQKKKKRKNNQDTTKGWCSNTCTSMLYLSSKLSAGPGGSDRGGGESNTTNRKLSQLTSAEGARGDSFCDSLNDPLPNLKEMISFFKSFHCYKEEPTRSRHPRIHHDLPLL